MNINHLVSKLSKQVAKEKANFKVGDTVKLINTSNKGGLNKNGRTGTILRIEGDQLQVNLHCTHTGGHKTKSLFIKELNRYVAVTDEFSWYSKQDVIKI
jgi:hypothetical protein